YLHRYPIALHSFPTRRSSDLEIIDNAMDAIEKNNNSLRVVLNKNYASPDIDKTRLGGVVDLVSNISLKGDGKLDLLGRVYEYFRSEEHTSELQSRFDIVRSLL